MMSKSKFHFGDEEHGESGEGGEAEFYPGPKTLDPGRSIAKTLLKLHRSERIEPEEDDELTRYFRNSKLLTSMTDALAQAEYAKKYTEPNFELMEHLYNKLSDEPPLKTCFQNLRIEKELLEDEVFEAQNEVLNLKQEIRDIASMKNYPKSPVTPDDKLAGDTGEAVGEDAEEELPLEDVNSKTQITEIGFKTTTKSKANRKHRKSEEKKVMKKKV